MTKRGKAAASVKFQAVMTEHAAMNAAKEQAGFFRGEAVASSETEIQKRLERCGDRLADAITKSTVSALCSAICERGPSKIRWKSGRCANTRCMTQMRTPTPAIDFTSFVMVTAPQRCGGQVQHQFEKFAELDGARSTGTGPSRPITTRTVTKLASQTGMR
jgi:hypothetical protein